MIPVLLNIFRDYNRFLGSISRATLSPHPTKYTISIRVLRSHVKFEINFHVPTLDMPIGYHMGRKYFDWLAKIKKNYQNFSWINECSLFFVVSRGEVVEPETLRARKYSDLFSSFNVRSGIQSGCVQNCIAETLSHFHNILLSI